MRDTVTTFKNDTSSRSHAGVRIRFINKSMMKADPGEFLIFDLAGSENSADTQFHDKEMQN